MEHEAGNGYYRQFLESSIDRLNIHFRLDYCLYGLNSEALALTICYRSGWAPTGRLRDTLYSILHTPYFILYVSAQTVSKGQAVTLLTIDIV